MKILKTAVFMALITASCMQASAQLSATAPVNEPNYNKPKLFADLPEKMNLRVSELEGLFNLPVGSKVTALIAPGFPVVGNVVSKSNPVEAAVKSIVINTTNRHGATLTFSRVTTDDGSISYVGRMISKNNGDAFEIAKENGQYIIRKTGLYDLISE